MYFENEKWRRVKIYLFNSYFILILTCEALTWIWTKDDINRLTAAEMRFLRRAKGETRRGRMRNKN